MKNLFKLKNLILIAFLVATLNLYSQSKEEKKAKLIDTEVGMYSGTKSKKAQSLYYQAIDLVKAQNYKGALKVFKKALKEDPKFVEVYDNMGVCYRRLGDFKNAIAYYNKSLKLYPQGTMAHTNLGVIYGIQKEYKKAIAEYEIVQEINPEDPEGYYGTINNYMMLNDFESAIQNSKKAMEIYEATDSKHIVEAQYLLGLSYYYNGDKKEAKIYLELAKKGGIKIHQQFVEELEMD